MDSIDFNCPVAVSTGENMDGTKYQIHVGSWWNGEGVNIDIDSGTDKYHLMMSTNELESLFACVVAMKMVYMDEVHFKANDMVSDSEDVRERILKIREQEGY
jgi:hypothetical protein